jgi:hypothetical protein
MADFKLISDDSHVNEPGDLWTERIDAAFRDRAPRIVDGIPGRPPGSYLVLEGVPPIHVTQGLGAGKKPEELEKFFETTTYKDARRGGWDPVERIKDQELDGVEAEVIYTTLGFRQFWLKDGALQRACFRAYNDWLAEYCSYEPRRLAGLAMMSLYDVDEAVTELRRCRKIGLRGAMIWASPPEDRPYSDGLYDPFWAEAQELRMPLSLHSITGMGPESQTLRAMGREIKPRSSQLKGRRCRGPSRDPRGSGRRRSLSRGSRRIPEDGPRVARASRAARAAGRTRGPASVLRTARPLKR